jgi:hypothetical protein
MHLLLEFEQARVFVARRAILARLGQAPREGWYGYFCPTHRKGKSSRRTWGLNYLLEEEAEKRSPAVLPQSQAFEGLVALVK